MKIGPFSRRGKSRLVVDAADHDMHPDAILVPFGVLEVACGEHQIGQLNVIYGHSGETADFIADALTLWWEQRRECYPEIRKLMIELDNGPELNSSRRQFMKRVVDFVDATGLEIELLYLPPYHSKYNPVERDWGFLEQHWNGALLPTIESALEWTKSLVSRGIKVLVSELTGTYATGVTLTDKAMQAINARLTRDASLPKWSLTIMPNSG